MKKSINSEKLIKLIDYTVNQHPYHWRRINSFIGLYLQVKITGCNSFEDFVNKHNLTPKHYFEEIQYITSDSQIDNFITGELYDLLLELRLRSDEIDKSGECIVDRGFFNDFYSHLNLSFRNEDDEIHSGDLP